VPPDRADERTSPSKGVVLCPIYGPTQNPSTKDYDWMFFDLG
jgi:hypothetical protein